MLIIGCGNRHRGDDAAGLLAAERLRALGIPAEVCNGESAELIAAWAGLDDVILIDAVMTGVPAGTIHVWNANDLPTFATSNTSTHGFGVAEAIELARALGRLPAQLRIYAIEGSRFDVGSEVSVEVARGVEEVVKRIQSERGSIKR